MPPYTLQAHLWHNRDVVCEVGYTVRVWHRGAGNTAAAVQRSYNSNGYNALPA
jgi:hypothetical protein